MERGSFFSAIETSMEYVHPDWEVFQPRRASTPIGQTEMEKLHEVSFINIFNIQYCLINSLNNILVCTLVVVYDLQKIGNRLYFHMWMFGCLLNMCIDTRLHWTEKVMPGM